MGLIPFADLPTSGTCKSGDFEKKPRKTWRLGPQTWRFPKCVLNENKNGRFLVSKYSLPYLCYLLYSFAAVDARRQIEFTVHSQHSQRPKRTYVSRE